jgi:hypothetical protein
MEEIIVSAALVAKESVMNPWIDILGWTVVIMAGVFLRYEIPRAYQECKKIIEEEMNNGQ